MAKLSAEEIKAYAAQAGFSGRDLSIAVAVAFAESGGDPNAINDKNRNGSTDYGLFQINSIHKSILAGGQWNNPADNAKMAYKVFSDAGKKWRPWAAYNNGSYLQFLGKAMAADTATVPNAPNYQNVGVVGGAVDGIKAVVEFAQFIVNPRNWVRLIYAIAGGIIIMLALAMMLKQSPQIKKAAGVATLVATKGKVKV